MTIGETPPTAPPSESDRDEQVAMRADPAGGPPASLDEATTTSDFDAASRPLRGESRTFIGPRDGPRWRVESVFVRLVATSGIVGLSVALAAILGTQAVGFWIVGLAVSVLSVVLAAILWSSRTL